MESQNNDWNHDSQENNTPLNPATDAKAMTTDAQASETAAPKSARQEFREWVYAIVFAIVITMLIKGFLFDIVRVDGHSMDSTLQNNNRLILWELGYTPKFQDVIVLDSNYKARMDYIEASQKSGTMGKFSATWFKIFPSTEYKKVPYIKRVIGLPGDTIDIRDNHVYINGKQIDEPYLDDGMITNTNGMAVPAQVPEGYIFVMGDNRTNSLDSRSSQLGFVPMDAVLGKATLRIWPLTEIGLVHK